MSEVKWWPLALEYWLQIWCLMSMFDPVQKKFTCTKFWLSGSNFEVIDASHQCLWPQKMRGWKKSFETVVHNPLHDMSLTLMSKLDAVQIFDFGHQILSLGIKLGLNSWFQKYLLMKSIVTAEDWQSKTLLFYANYKEKNTSV